MARMLRLLDELTRTEARELAPRALLVLPVGAVEQHGPHLPIGTDTLLVTHVARAAAARAGERIDTVLAPTVAYGSSGHHIPFGGTLSLGSATLHAAAGDLVRSAAASGFRRIFLLNGHGGNDLMLQQVARDVPLDHVVDVAAGSYWTIAWQELLAAGAWERGGLPGHAGAFETSLLLALRPELVHAPPHREPEAAGDSRSLGGSFRAERHGTWQRIDGYSDSPAAGDAALGAAYLAAIVEAVAGAFVSFTEDGR